MKTIKQIREGFNPHDPKCQKAYGVVKSNDALGNFKIHHKTSGKHIGSVESEQEYHGDRPIGGQKSQAKHTWRWAHAHSPADWGDEGQKSSEGNYKSKAQAVSAQHAHHDKFKKQTAALLKKL